MSSPECMLADLVEPWVHDGLAIVCGALGNATRPPLEKKSVIEASWIARHPERRGLAAADGRPNRRVPTSVPISVAI
jgi:hypothetical protein